MYEKVDVPAICYTLETPVYYNKGTIYEKTEDTFLACYTSRENGPARVEELNNNSARRAEFEKSLRIKDEPKKYFYTMVQSF